MAHSFALRKNLFRNWRQQNRKRRMIWLEIRESKYLLRKGLQENGVFARRAFSKNSTIGIFRGERMTEKQADLRLDTKWQIKLASGDVVVDMVASDCKLKFVNRADRRRDQNCMIKTVGRQAVLVALKSIAAGDELLAWYEV